MHQSCAAVPSAYSAVVRRWLCSYSSRALVVPCVGLLAVLRLLLFGLWLGALVFFAGLFVAGLLRRSRLVAPRESGLLSLLDPCLWLYLVNVDFLIVSVFWPFLRYFPSCGVPARWRDLRHVFLDICRK